MITFDPNLLTLTPINLVNVTYGKQSTITITPSKRSKKRESLNVSHNVARLYKSNYSQMRYPLTVVAAILRYDDQIIDIVRHPDIFIADIKDADAVSWLKRQQAILLTLKSQLQAYAGMPFDGEYIIGDDTDAHVTIAPFEFHLREAIKLGSQYREMLRKRDEEGNIAHKVKWAAAPISTIERGGMVLSTEKSGFGRLIENQEVKELASIVNDSTVTLAYIDSYVTSICATFGYSNVDLFDVLGIIEALGTPDLRRVDPIVKHNFYTSTRATAVIERLMALGAAASTVEEVSVIRRQMNALLQRGMKIVSQNREFLNLVAKVLQPNKQVEDVHMIDYDQQYNFAMITGAF